MISSTTAFFQQLFFHELFMSAIVVLMYLTVCTEAQKQIVACVMVRVTGRDKAVWKSILPQLCLPTVASFVVHSPSPTKHVREIFPAYFKRIILPPLQCLPANPIHHKLILTPFCLNAEGYFRTATELCPIVMQLSVNWRTDLGWIVGVFLSLPERKIISNNN